MTDDDGNVIVFDQITLNSCNVTLEALNNTERDLSRVIAFWAVKSMPLKIGPHIKAAVAEAWRRTGVSVSMSDNEGYPLHRFVDLALPSLGFKAYGPSSITKGIRGERSFSRRSGFSAPNEQMED
jgi:hypothetical protein